MTERRGCLNWIPGSIWRLIAAREDKRPMPGEQRGRLLGRVEDAGRFRSPEEAHGARDRAGIVLAEADVEEPPDIDRVSREDNAAMREHFRAERGEAGLDAD
jgi:hypothetical protein